MQIEVLESSVVARLERDQDRHDHRRSAAVASASTLAISEQMMLKLELKCLPDVQSP